LASNHVREVVIVGRRGPAQAAFTNPELRELGELSEADVIVNAQELEQALAVPDPTLEGNAIARNNVKILREYSQRPPQGRPLRGGPFDERRGIISNDGGRVTDPQSGAALPGEYVVGWIKRGPTGVIGTNKKDAQETVDAIFADLAASSNGSLGDRAAALPDGAGIERMLRERQPDLVPYEGWLEIDRHERSRGQRAGRPRVKLTRIDEMLQIAASEEPPG